MTPKAHFLYRGRKKNRDVDFGRTAVERFYGRTLKKQRLREKKKRANYNLKHRSGGGGENT